MHGDCFNGECTSNCGGGVMMFSKELEITILLMVLLGIDIFPTDKEE